MISAPDDYGLSPEQTLSHTADIQPPERFDAYWAQFRDAIATLPERWRGTIDTSVNHVVIPSLGAVRVVARLSMPKTQPTGAVITTHGYGGVGDGFPDEPEPWLERGLATLRLRVRGYPPSTMDIDDLRGTWILHGIESPDAWILRGAVADLIQAYRCTRSHFGAAMPIVVHGESFGGGLAVIATAQLAALGHQPHRLTLGLPTFGDWRWRSMHYCNGSGGQVNMMLDALRGMDRERLMETLLLFDAVLHASSVDIPCLAKLAVQDDTVPAPTAAAIYNALPTAEKWRFETRYGHFDGGIADMRRHALFERLHPVFADPQVSPQEAVEPYLSQMRLTLPQQQTSSTGSSAFSSGQSA